MRPLTKALGLGACITLALIWALSEPAKSFTFTADLPPDFTYRLTAAYVPATGETCSVPGGRNTKVVFNRLGKEYNPISEVQLFRTVSGCALMLNHAEVKIIGIHSRNAKRAYSSFDRAQFSVTAKLPKHLEHKFNNSSLNEFYGQCQWFFRTIGPERYITKILFCRKTDAHGNIANGRPFSAYNLEQLRGNTIKLNIQMADVELPYMKDTWIKVPGGWKRCMGKSFADQHAFCNGNHENFSTFRMVDGRVCTIYPGCTESKKVTP